mgnify:CR=1 FL=1
MAEVGYSGTKAAKLVGMFIDNFGKFESHVDEGVKQAAPTAA